MTILIVDDEPLARDRLAALLTDLVPADQIITAASVPAAEAALAQARPPVEVVLLDIEMPGQTGLDWLQSLSQLTSPPAVIMTTAWADYALPAIQQGADGYLLKPVKADELRTALERAQRQNRLQARQLNPRVPINADGTGDHVALDSICCCTAESRWVRVVTDEHEHVSDRPLKEWEELYPQALVRIHRAHLIGLAALESLQREDGQYQVVLRNGDRLPVSRRHVRPLRQRLGNS
ncbi:MAG: LytTR family DNA-binding domain-containing protein [Natronospirillum sp.]|uniref:LytR/AlgR family response regulator transcription factor n=1 Tax=Natronospirillum sp. TaxID=2812955 RepID=UPI0025E4DC3E|nr:LytTR family DNA-binding domain-containing protein [Natronospirillum sp.]MCH8551757.1 LytTR family DNA-binding domain-containing protein [Natronospirillum sp.]